MRGYKRKRGSGWTLEVSIGLDPKTGKYAKRSKTFKGSARDADRELSKFVAEVEQGATGNANSTLASFLNDEWFPSVEGELSDRTLVKYRRYIDLHIVPRIGRMKLRDVTTLALEKFYRDLTKDGRLDGKGGLDPTFIRDLAVVLGQALGAAVRWKLLPANPAATARRPKVQRKRFAVMVPERAREVLAKAPGTNVDAVVALGVGAGLRRGEMLALRWSDVDFEAREIHVLRSVHLDRENIVRAKAPKTEAGTRDVPLTAGTAEALRRCRAEQTERRLAAGTWQDEDLVLDRGDGGFMEPTLLSHRWGRFARKHGFGEFRLHDLRHGYATLMLAAGVPLEVVSEMMGHSSIVVTKDIYADILPKAKVDAAGKLEALLAGGGE